MQKISPIVLKDKIESGEPLFLLDIREPYELQICSIEAHSIPMADVEKRVSEIPKDIPVVVFCRSGRRAEALTNYLCIEHGFKNLLLLEGGILAWIDQVDQSLEKY